MEVLIAFFAGGSVLFVVIVSGVYLTARWLLLWTARVVSSGIDRFVARAGEGAMTRMRAYALARGMTLPEAERRFAAEVDRLAWWTEGLIRVPGLGPVGLDALLGLVPLAGDAFGAWLGLRLVARAMKYGLPPELVSKLLANVLTDAFLGVIPVAGDLADIWFRGNTRNARLVRDYLKSSTADTRPTA